MSSEVNDRRGPGSGIQSPEDVLAEFDRALRAELSVTPSPEFEARVRQRIDERAARRWTWTPFYTWVTAAASVVVVAGTVAMLNSGPVPRDHRPSPPPASAPNPVAPVREIAASNPTVHRPTAPRATTRHASTPRRTEAPAVASSSREPEVIVPPQHAEALRRFVRGVANGRIEAAAEPVHTVAGVPDAMELEPLVIAPIAPIPLPGTESLGGITPVVRGF